MNSKGSRKVRKPESPEDSLKSDCGMSNAELENPSAFDIPQSEINKSEIEHPQYEIKTMEVHHHPNVEKKNFKEYMLEGLMIFLAVMMGFFAESLRERIDNNEKGHEYVQSLLVDLKADTAKINDYFDHFVISRARYKLLLDDLEKPLRHDTAYLSKFYDAAHYTLGLAYVRFTNRVVSQLKSSDNFRLIINNEVAGEITDYSNGTVACENQEKVVEYFTEDSEKFARQMINMKAYGFLDTQRGIDNTIALISTNHKDIEQYANAIYIKAAVESSYCQSVREQKQRAIKLIMLLKKEYNLNDE